MADYEGRLTGAQIDALPGLITTAQQAADDAAQAAADEETRAKAAEASLQRQINDGVGTTEAVVLPSITGDETSTVNPPSVKGVIDYVAKKKAEIETEFGPKISQHETRITALEDSGGGLNYTEDSTTIYVVSNGYVDTTPRISVSPTEINLSPSIGATTTKTITVVGYNLTEQITAVLTDTSGYYSIDNTTLSTDGGTITLTYNPLVGGTHNATLNISSGSDADASISITGVAATPTISVDKSSLTLGGESGVAVNGSFTVSGTSLEDVINISCEGDGFTVSPSIITINQAINGATVIVSFDASADSGTATITLSSTNAESVTVNATYTAITRKAAGETITYSNGTTNLLCTVLDGQQEVSVKDSGSSAAVVIPETVTDENGFSYSVTKLAYQAFYQKRAITSLVIPDTVNEFLGGTGNYSSYSYAAYQCTNLVSLTIGSGLKTMRTSAFMYCYALTSVNIKDGCTNIGDQAFSGCSSLTELYVPSSVTTINNAAFTNTGIKKIQFGNSEHTISGSMEGSLYTSDISLSSTKLEVIIMYCSTPPSVWNIQYGGGMPPGFRNYDSSTPNTGSSIDTNGTGRLYVPSAAIRSYQSNTNWGRMVGNAEYSGDSAGRIYAIEDIGTISGYESDSLIVSGE